MADYIIHAVHKCSIHDGCGHRLVRNYRPGQYSWSYEKLREEILSLFELPPSAPIKLRYSDGKSGDVSICDYEELYDAHVRQKINPLGVKVVYTCPSPLVKVLHKDIYHLLTPPREQREFCFEELHDRVRKLIGLHDLSHSAADFVFSFKDPKGVGPQMIVESGAALKYALEKESPTHLEVKIKAIEADNENNICHSSGKSTPNDVVKILHNGIVRSLDLSAGELESSCEEFQSRVGGVFQLSRSDQLQLNYVDEDGDTITISKGEKLKDALSRQTRKPFRFNMATNSSLAEITYYVVKVSHSGTVRRLTLPPDEFQFSYQNFRSSIEDLFMIPPEFELSYLDEDQDSIQMVEDEDLRGALVVQSLHPLKVLVKIINGGIINDTHLRASLNCSSVTKGIQVRAHAGEVGERSIRRTSDSLWVDAVDEESDRSESPAR